MSKAANKIIEGIKNSEITEELVIPEEQVSKITINYKNNNYYGFSLCHPDDIPYYSKFIGLTIAHYRAMLNALEEEVYIARVEYKILKHSFCAVNQNQDIDVIDPTKKFRTRLYRSENKYNELKKAKKALKKEMQDYIKDINKTFEFMDKKNNDSKN